jgi:hypothetical protein
MQYTYKCETIHGQSVACSSLSILSISYNTAPSSSAAQLKSSRGISASCFRSLRRLPVTRWSRLQNLCAWTKTSSTGRNIQSLNTLTPFLDLGRVNSTHLHRGSRSPVSEMPALGCMWYNISMTTYIQQASEKNQKHTKAMASTKIRTQLNTFYPCGSIDQQLQT